MTDSVARAARFETHRPHLLAVALRLLGSTAEAEDAVQEAWLRLDRTGDDGIVNLAGWLTTVVSRICLDHLRTRSTRGETSADSALPEFEDLDPGPEDMAILTESTAEALAVVLERLAPLERVALVLHDVFDVPFEDVAEIVDRSAGATRQLASRARRKLREPSDAGGLDGTRRLGSVVEAFLRASRSGDLEALVAVLDPDVVLRSDDAAFRMGARTGWLESDLNGADAVARQFSGRAEAARLANIDGRQGAVWAPGGTPRVVFRFTVDRDTIISIDLIADPETLATMDVTIIGVHGG